jgi:hypothetical protein
MKLSLAFTVLVCQAAQCLAGGVPSVPVDVVPGPLDELDVSGLDAVVRREPLIRPKLSFDNSNGTGSMLLPRAPEPGDEQADEYGPVIPNGSGCLFCPEAQHLALTGWDLLNALTTEQMKAYSRVSGRKPLHNRCVFYSRAIKKPPEYLSSAASIWACKYNKYSIWHLWPNKVVAGNNPKLKDFYGFDKPGNWLYSISQLAKRPGESKPPYINYFENMSEAMAQMCTGEVVIMSQTPKDMAQYLNDENIWKNKERPALLNSIRDREVTNIYVVDFYDQDKIYEFDLESNTLGRQVKISDLESGRVGRRDDGICSTSGLDDSIEKDWFNAPYDKL